MNHWEQLTAWFCSWFWCVPSVSLLTSQAGLCPSLGCLAVPVPLAALWLCIFSGTVLFCSLLKCKEVLTILPSFALNLFCLLAAIKTKSHVLCKWIFSILMLSGTLGHFLLQTVCALLGGGVGL